MVNRMTSHFSQAQLPVSGVQLKQSFGAFIKKHRIAKKMTQEELAEACDLSAGYISQLEGPGSYFCPSLKTLFKIAEVLGTTVSKLTDVED